MRLVNAFVLVLFYLASAHAADLPLAPKNSDYRKYTTAQIKLGQLLFYDRVLSGTYRVSCATCHNHDRASSNGFRLDGKDVVEGDALAVNGLPIYDVLKPSSKHAPTLFNLGAKEFSTLFSDGRVALESDGAFQHPGAEELPPGLQDVLAVQALFPAVTGDELVGKVDSDISAVAHLGNRAIWKALSKRVQELPDYWPHFQAAYPKLKSQADLSIVEIANSISAFVGTEWRSDNSPFDDYLRGDKNALSPPQVRGMKLFYGDAQCSICHSGTFQTDHEFHFVPHSFWRFDVKPEDRTKDINFGRFKQSGKQSDKFAVRTPSLRNVVITAPYGHAGGVKSLRQMIAFHLLPEEAMEEMNWDLSRLGLKDEVLLASKNSIYQDNKEMLSVLKINDLLEFLESLTDKNSLEGRLGKPKDVPSSLVLD